MIDEQILKDRRREQIYSQLGTMLRLDPSEVEITFKDSELEDLEEALILARSMIKEKPVVSTVLGKVDIPEITASETTELRHKFKREMDHLAEVRKEQREAKEAEMNEEEESVAAESSEPKVDNIINDENSDKKQSLASKLQALLFKKKKP